MSMCLLLCTAYVDVHWMCAVFNEISSQSGWHTRTRSRECCVCKRKGMPGKSDKNKPSRDETKFTQFQTAKNTSEFSWNLTINNKPKNEGNAHCSLARWFTGSLDSTDNHSEAVDLLTRLSQFLMMLMLLLSVFHTRNAAHFNIKQSFKLYYFIFQRRMLCLGVNVCVCVIFGKIASERIFVLRCFNCLTPTELEINASERKICRRQHNGHCLHSMHARTRERSSYTRRKTEDTLLYTCGCGKCVVFVCTGLLADFNLHIANNSIWTPILVCSAENMKTLMIAFWRVWFIY